MSISPFPRTHRGEARAFFSNDPDPEEYFREGPEGWAEDPRKSRRQANMKKQVIRKITQEKAPPPAKEGKGRKENLPKQPSKGTQKLS